MCVARCAHPWATLIHRYGMVDRTEVLMTLSMEGVSVSVPGRREPQSAAEKRLQARTDAESLQIHAQFVRAHGLPKGKITMLSSAGVFSCGFARSRAGGGYRS